MKVLNVAILGQGRSGRNIHGSHILKDERFKVVAVVDPLEERRERALKEYPGCQVYEKYEDLFGRTDIDFVVNSTPSHMHQPIAIDLMRHGFNVLQEKPIAANTAQVKELEQTIKETGCMYAIFLQSRYRSQFAKAREIAASGVLGRLVEVKVYANGYSRRWDWQTVQEYCAGSLYNTGPHPVGQALEFLDYYDGMPQVFCHMDRVNSFGDAEDFVKIILKAPDRPLIDIEISSSDAYSPYAYHIQGSCGTLTVDTKSVRWKYFKPEEAPEQHLIREPLFTEDRLPSYCREQLTWYEEEWVEPYVHDNVFSSDTKRLYDDVYNYLTEGKPFNVTFKQVAQQIAIMEECHRQNPLSRLDK
ncbi:MAG: Gfo/Idh/MocA family oxidoreductase [Ruminococcaceae bacterium]|nr:Gfo/Idh/MocA family oxidoreductase [Oscillospiraceae bacterium]